MNKIVRPNYLCNYEESLIVVASEIEDIRGIHLDINALSEQLQLILKSIKCRCGDNDIIENIIPQVFL